MRIQFLTNLRPALMILAIASFAMPNLALPATATAKTIWLKQNIGPTDGSNFSSFGDAVAVSGDTAVVGADFSTAPNSTLGVAYIFTKTNGAWSESQEIYSSDSSASNFGGSVSTDGTTIVIGAYNNNSGQGAAYVFTKSNGTWSQVKKLTANDGASYDDFGSNVAVDGSSIFIGAPGKNYGQGAVYVFSGSGSSWTQTQEFTGTVSNGNFGRALALNGTLAIVGQPGVAASPAPRGYAYIFSLQNGSWVGAGQLMASDGGAGDNFGESVAIAGTTALVGANSGCGTCQGAVYVFTGSNGSWTQTQKLTASNGVAGNDFGASIALSRSSAVIGDPFAPAGTDYEQGTLYVFSSNSGSWSQTQMLTPENPGFSGNYGFGFVLGSGQTGVFAGDGDYINGGTSYYFGQGNLDLTVSAPAGVMPGGSYVSQTLVTNDATVQSPAVSVTIAVPAAVTFVSADASQGSCSETSGIVRCDFGAIDGNAGAATANVTFKATATVGTTIPNRGTVVGAQPPLQGKTTTTVDNPPTASSGTLTVNENSSAKGTLSATDSDGNPLTFSIVTPPAHGTASITDTTTGTYTYTPNRNYSGSDSLTFKANDGYLDSNAVQVNITVKAVNTNGGNGSGGGGGLLAWPVLLALIGFALAVAFRKIKPHHNESG